MTTLKSTLKIGSYNCRTRMTRDDFVTDLILYFENQEFDIICLQETGFLTPEVDISERILYPYILRLNCGPNLNASTGFLIHKTMMSNIRSIQNGSDGRIQFLYLNLNKLNLCISNVYFPTNLEYSSEVSHAFIRATEMVEELKTKFEEFEGKIIVGGDFNETRYSFERSSKVQGPYGCRIIHSLLSTGSVSDASIHDNQFTFTGWVYGNRTSAKLDRFLVSPDFLNMSLKYQVHSDENSDLGSDHLLVSLLVPLHYPVRSSFNKRKYPKLHPKFLTLESRQQGWVSINQEMKTLLHQLQKMTKNVFGCQKYMNQIFEIFVEIIHNKTRMLKRVGSKKNLQPHILIKQLILRRRNLRKLKFSITPFLKESGTSVSKIPQSVVSLGNQIFPSNNWTSGNFSSVSRELRVEISQITNRINTLLSINKELSTQKNENDFVDSRSSFYAKYIRGTTRDKGLLGQIFDPSNQKLLVRPDEVKHHVFDEAQKTFHYNPTPPPKPDWFKWLYDPANKPCTPETWAPLLQPFSRSEVIATLKAVKGKAPGLDGLTKEMLLFLCEPNPMCENPYQRDYTSYTSKCLIFLVNKGYTTGICPEICSRGQILPIRKPGKDPSIYSNQRPLTMLSEIGKLPMKILATRLQKIFYKNPQILDFNQNAFLKEGGIDGPIRFLVDQISVHQSLKHPLFIIAYDQAKAYDSIQWWHVEITLDRFSIPAKFKTFILNYLRNSTSCVLTAHGNTNFFNLKCSVRQGDPLSPLLYIMCLDGLHTLLAELSQRKNLGISWTTGTTLHRVSSLGYADDTAILAKTPEEIHALHSLLCEYFSAHSLRLNCKKTEARYIAATPSILTPLMSFDWKIEQEQISWKDETSPFRYLGVFLRGDLDPSFHLKKCEQQRLYPYISRIKNNRMNLNQTVYAIREMIWSILDFSTKFMVVSSEFIEKWDSMFARALVRKANICK